MKGLGSEETTQFCIFVENKVGRLGQLIRMLASLNIHVLALTTQDTNDSSIIRLVVDDPEKTRQHLNLNAFAFCEVEVVCAEMTDNTKLIDILTILANTEINISYIYSFIYRPNGKSAMVIHLDDPDLASDVLPQHGIKVLKLKDLAR